MIRVSQWKESICRTNSSIRIKKEIQKSRAMTVTVRNLTRKLDHLSKVIWDRKIITEFTGSISFTTIGKPVLMMNIKVSKDKLRDSHLCYMKQNHKPCIMTMLTDRGKRRRILSEVKLVENIS